MTVTIFTAGHRSPRGTFYPHAAAPEVEMDARDAATLLRLLGIINRHLPRIPAMRWWTPRGWPSG